MSSLERKLADGILGRLDTLLTEGWITVNGARILIDDDTGEVTGGPKGLRDKVFKDAESKPLEQAASHSGWQSRRPCREV